MKTQYLSRELLCFIDFNHTMHSFISFLVSLQSLCSALTHPHVYSFKGELLAADVDILHPLTMFPFFLFL